MSFLEEVEYIFEKHSNTTTTDTGGDTNVANDSQEHDVSNETTVTRDAVEEESVPEVPEYFFDKNEEPLSF